MNFLFLFPLFLREGQGELNKMKSIIKIIIISILLFSCGNGKTFDPPDNPDPEPTIADLFFGTDSTFDVLTWNIQEFPKNGNTTISYVLQIIEALNVDVIALQEMDSETDFVYLKNSLIGWNGFRASYPQSSYYNPPVAYLYNSNTIQMDDIFEIFIYDDRPFPRPPLIMELIWNSVPIVMINNHLKAGGDGIIDHSDSWDEEHRRMDACVMLEEYISENYLNSNVILLGDLNDNLTDQLENNVFEIFLDDIEIYRFADMGIAIGNNSNWSWGNGSSHLDHILVTNELFDEFENPDSKAETILIDDYLQFGWQEYEDNISDHLPVGLKLKFN
ncbi:MAG TPA: hypothetical protein ENL20_10730 [Candidatus Cloacimonetes bacterium]|nr:hypothetical protein [Candidatus Cloacimonadota bacterium]